MIEADDSWEFQKRKGIKVDNPPYLDAKR